MKMGFFDFLKTKTTTGYNEVLINQNWEEDFKKNTLFLPDSMQAVMYTRVRQIKEATDLAMQHNSQKNLQTIVETTTAAIEQGKSIEKWLIDNNVDDIKSEHIISAFYLVNLADITLKHVSEFTDNEIKNTFATNLAFGLGYRTIQPDQITAQSVSKVKETAKWIDIHPMNY